MDLNLHKSWLNLLDAEFKQPYFVSLTEFVANEYEIHTCYPEKELIFAAFEKFAYQQTKVVIIGQDPYHGVGQANGLCFSVKDEVPMPPSLINIFKELNQDIAKPIPKSGNLEYWAKQGVLLLNATLTVRAHQPGSHQNKGWERFTDTVIKQLSDECEDIVFLLWGGFAKKKMKLIDTNKHNVLITGHPSPLSANRGYWFGNRHFSKTNEILLEKGKIAIRW